MVLIVLSWVYVFISASLFGTLANRIFNIKNGLVITQFLGFFLIALLASSFAIFSNIGSLFHGLLFSINLGIAVYYRRALIQEIKAWKVGLKQYSTFIKIVFFVISFLIIAKCATRPYVIDNESYYLQTIKWLNEYGFVKGLANLHFFFGQTSGWHVLQSVFNFDFLYGSFNDLSGYCLWLGNLFALQQLNVYFKNKKPLTGYLIFGLFPLANVLYFQFINAPSPDIPVVIISFVIFWLLIKEKGKPSRSAFISICLLCFFTLYIKVSTVFLALIPLVLFIQNYKRYKKALLPIGLFGFFTFVLLIAKNQILTGYPLYPLEYLQVVKTDYALPEEIQTFFYRKNKAFAYYISFDQYEGLSVMERFLTWFQMSKLHGFFNKLIVVLMLVIPFLIQKFKTRKTLYFIYALAVFQLVVLFLTSPQYRFFFVFVLFFINIIITVIFGKKWLIKTFLITSVVVSAIPLFFQIDLNAFTTNRFAMSLNTFKPSYFITPHNNSKYTYKYETSKEGNLNYNSPIPNDFFWITGDGPLPAVNTDQIEYFKKKLGIVPQLRTGDLKDGFYSKKINEQ